MRKSHVIFDTLRMDWLSYNLIVTHALVSLVVPNSKVIKSIGFLCLRKNLLECLRNSHFDRSCMFDFKHYHCQQLHWSSFVKSTEWGRTDPSKCPALARAPVEDNLWRIMNCHPEVHMYISNRLSSSYVRSDC